jgi:hypothetical protein
MLGKIKDDLHKAYKTVTDTGACEGLPGIIATYLVWSTRAAKKVRDDKRPAKSASTPKTPSKPWVASRTWTFVDVKFWLIAFVSLRSRDTGSTSMACFCVHLNKQVYLIWL